MTTFGILTFFLKFSIQLIFNILKPKSVICSNVLMRLSPLPQADFCGSRFVDFQLRFFFLRKRSCKWRPLRGSSNQQFFDLYPLYLLTWSVDRFFYFKHGIETGHKVHEAQAKLSQALLELDDRYEGK